MKKRRTVLSFPAMVLLVLLPLLSCSTQKGSIHSSVLPYPGGAGCALGGKVADDQNAPLPGVTVTLSGAAIKRVYVTTDAAGSYQFTNLPEGKYSLDYELMGFTALRQEDVELMKSRWLQVDVRLHPASEELVVVTGEAPMVDTTDSGLTTVFHAQSSPPVAHRHKRSSQPANPMPAAAPAEAQLMAQADEILVVVSAEEESGTTDATAARPPAMRARNQKGEEKGDFPLRQTEARTEISGLFARTLIRQVYGNPYSEPVEAVYIFPMPHKAAVYDFLMEVGGRRIVGIVRPREEAEQLYQQAREQGQVASLLTQERPNVFTQNVANIEPGGTVAVEITYLERVAYRKGFFEYVFPMVVAPRYIPGAPVAVPATRRGGGGISGPTDHVPDADKITPPNCSCPVNGIQDMSLILTLEAGLPIQKLESTTHKIEVLDEGPSRRIIQLAAEEKRVNRDFVLRWSTSSEQFQLSSLAHKTAGDAGFFSLVIQTPPEPANRAAVSPREITFVIDSSGSMQGEPLSLSKKIVLKTLERMRDFDLFNILWFSETSSSLWESARPATAANLEEARKQVKRLEGIGGTEMYRAIETLLQAERDPKLARMYVLLTDGEVGDDGRILALVRQYRSQARFFAIGIGASVNRYLIDGIGELGGGASRVAMATDEGYADKSAEWFFEAIDSPLLTGVSIDWNGLPVRDAYPRKLPVLYAGETVAIVGRYDAPADGTAYLKGWSGDREVTYALDVKLPDLDEANEVLAPVWGRQKIQDLSAKLLTAGADKQVELVEQIKQTAMQFHLVSDYTSFVAVDESRVVGNGRPLKVLQPVELPQGVTAEGVFANTGQASIASWGLTVARRSDGKLEVTQVDPSGIAQLSGVKQGELLRSVNRTVVHDLLQLEGLILQSNAALVQLEFDSGTVIQLPNP